METQHSINSFLLKLLKISVLVNTALSVLGLFWVIFDKDLRVFFDPWSTSHPVTTLLVPLPDPRPLFRSLSPPRSALFPGGWHNFHQQAQRCQGLRAELTSLLKHAKAATKSLLSFLRCSCKNPCLSTAKSKVCYLLKNYGVGGRMEGAEKWKYYMLEAFVRRCIPMKSTQALGIAGRSQLLHSQVFYAEKPTGLPGRELGQALLKCWRPHRILSRWAIHHFYRLW